MLLSIVVNLLSSINGTRSAPQAASPLVSIMVAEHSSLDSSSWAEKCYTNWSGEKKIILNLRLESLYKIWSVTVCNFAAAEFPKFIDILKWYISSARQPAPVRTRHANRLNTESNRGIRNVPLTETPMKLARDIRQLLNLQTVDSVCGNSVLARSS